MNEVLFNFHDVVLLMTAMQCLFFAALLLATNSRRLVSTYFLAAFLLAHALIPLHELILWGAVFKMKVRDTWPELYFLGGSAYYLDAVLLYFCVKSLIFRDFALHRRDALHLLPLLFFAFYMTLVFYRLSEAQRFELIESEQFVYSWHYISVDALAKFLRVFYCLWCLKLLMNYQRLLKGTHSNVNKVDTNWVVALVSGFLLVMSMAAALSVAKLIGLRQNFDLLVFERIGLTGYYTTFVLINLMVFTGIRYFASFEGVRRDSSKKPINECLLDAQVADGVDATMRRDKPFLQPDITLDHLAQCLAIPAKDLSMIINRYFGVNFYEFINRYRIEEAQRRLSSEAYRESTITDIYLDVGFNSKSVFNTFFKKRVGVTPSQYRLSQSQR